MYCPQCGQQQVSEVVRFCSRCGFPLDAVMELIASGGFLPAKYVQSQTRKLSRRQRGIRQGAMMMLSTLLVVPIVSIISVFLLRNPEVVIPIVALICFVGGLLRMIHAAMFEDNGPPVEGGAVGSYLPPAGSSRFGATGQGAALPPASINPASAWRPRSNTAEIVTPPSVTENTTRLLDDKTDSKPS
jgi:hypothetical protein